MKKWRIYFTVNQSYSKIKISGVTVEVYIMNILLPKESAVRSQMLLN